MTIEYTFAASTQGFYAPGLHDDIPEDAITLSAEQYTTLLDGQSAGKIIMPPDAEHDTPWLADPMPPAEAELARQRISTIKADLDRLDLKSIRAREFIAEQQRLKANGKSYQDWAEEQSVIDSINTERESLRAEMHMLELLAEDDCSH